MSHNRLQGPAQWLTCTGALPIAALSLVMIAQREAIPWMAQALVSYAAIILAFLGGIHWGRGLALNRPARLLVAVLPALYAWAASLLDWPLAGWLLAAGFLPMLAIDLRNPELPRWYRRMRIAVTLVVTPHLALAAALAPLPAPKQQEISMSKNVLGTGLQLCSSHPRTGFYRDGRCETGPDDHGTHTVCAVVTESFLDFTLRRGNDLITPRPDYNFPGLNPGDRWCLCALRWKEALQAGVAPPVILEATHAGTLEHVSRDELIRHAWPHFKGE